LTKDIFRGGVAGTSTGADLTAGIMCGIPAAQIATFYRRTGEVFNHDKATGDALLLSRGYKYDIMNLYRLVDSVLGPKGRQTINSFPTLILIPVRGVDGWYWYLTQDKPGATKLTGNVQLIDAAVGSSAAPTYFQEYNIPGIGLVVDGGVGVAGNPCYKLANEAFRYNADKFHPDSSVLVSIGTGKSPSSSTIGHSLLGKVEWILQQMLAAPEAQAPELVRDNFQDLAFLDFDIPLLSKIDMDQAANVPVLPPGCTLTSERVTESAVPGAMSAARVVYDYYGGVERFPSISEEMMAAVDKADAAQFSESEILDPQGWILMSFLMDPRTGLGRFREFRISNYQLMMQLIDDCTQMTVEEILQTPDVAERVALYNEHSERAADQIRRCSTVTDNLVVLDLRDEQIIHPTNRFMIYALYPLANVSIHVLWGLRQQNTVFATGKSIINRSSRTNVGELMLAHGGGGHDAAGTCQIANEDAGSVLGELVATITADG